MLALFLFLILVAVVLGIIAFVVKGAFYLLAIAVVVFLLSFVLVGTRLRRRHPVR